MEVIIKTNNNPVLFHTIISPVKMILEKQAQKIGIDSGKKLTFVKFIELLFFFYLEGIDSLRSLKTRLTDQSVAEIGLFPVGVSTIHDAFLRYQAAFVQAIHNKLVHELPLGIIDEFKELGRFMLIDGSIFPIVVSKMWAEFRKNSRALKLHLAFSLERMVANSFLVTSGKADERKQLEKLISKSITYIADRGYLSFDLFNTIANKLAFFIIRVRKNLHYQVLEEQLMPLPDALKYVFFQVSDQLVRFDADRHGCVYRRISFRTSQTIFIIVTNRFDLTTYDIIRLYGLRWQIELFFRFFKRSVGAIHLLNHSQDGITIQFYVVMIVHMLLLNYKQNQMQQCLFSKNNDLGGGAIFSGDDFVKALNRQIPSCFKLKKQELNQIRNSLMKNVQLSFDFW